MFEGSKSVKETAANGSIDRAITGVSSGVFYFAMMRPDTTGDATFRLLSGGSVWLGVTFETSNIILNDAGSTTLVTGYTASQWYVFEVTIISTSQLSVRYHNGVSWSSSTGTRTSGVTGSVDTIRLNSGASGTCYWDLITPTDPFPAAAPTANIVSYWKLDSETSSAVDSFSESNSDSSAITFTATVTGLGQTFTTTGATILKSAVFYMKKTGTPTGNANAKVYAITGTPNTDAKPTGSVLATSDNFDVSTLTGSLALITFTFSGAQQITLSAATNYAIVVEYGSADASNHPDFGVDLIGSSDATGNACRLTSGVWASQSYDVCFYVYTSYFSDSVGSNNLNNNNAAVLTTGKINSGVDLELGSVQSLTITDATQSGLDITGSISVSTWWKPESSSTFQWIVSKYLAAGNLRAYGLYFDSNTINFVVSTDGTAIVTASKSFTPSNGTWYHLVATLDVSSGICILYVNGVSLGPTGSFPGSVFNSSAQFGVGTGDAGTSTVDGVVDEVGIWSRFLTPLEITLLYNGGTGLQYPFTIVQNLTIAIAQGSYALTGQSVGLGRLIPFILATGNYLLTGFGVGLRFSGWTNQTKNTSTFTNQSKNTSSWANQNKS